MSFSAHDLQSMLKSVRLHPEAEAQEELQSERALTDNALRMIAPAAVPDDLALRLRLALSHEKVRAERRLSGRLRHGWQSFQENRLRPFALQAAVATIAMVVVIGGAMMLSSVTPQQMVQASDEPLTGFSAPRYLYSAAGEHVLGGVGDQPLMVQAKVDSVGRVYDYTLLSGQLDEKAAAALRQHMLTGVFQPAKVFGQPVRGTVVLTFADVLVRG